jgi:hypothetical protein
MVRLHEEVSQSGEPNFPVGNSIVLGGKVFEHGDRLGGLLVDDPRDRLRRPVSATGWRLELLAGQEDQIELAVSGDAAALQVERLAAADAGQVGDDQGSPRW